MGFAEEMPTAPAQVNAYYSVIYNSVKLLSVRFRFHILSVEN